MVVVMTNKPHNQLISAMLDKATYDHQTNNIELIETHISWVILTGKYAYKIKKPLNLGFLDFSTLNKRHYYCDEELRINSRLAPKLYLSVVTINGSKQQPHINGSGAIIEYAVKMRQFPQQAQLDKMLAQGLLTKSHMDELASIISKFHNSIEIAKLKTEYGNPEIILSQAIENFKQIKQQQNFVCNEKKLNELKNWTNDFYRLHKDSFIVRKNSNFIRECHGDMHLRNIAYWQNKILIFDNLEFDGKLRWIDVFSEIAFIVMDLDERNEHELSRRFLNAYLEKTGDYTGISILRFYLVYRAMVRAKIYCIQSQQEQITKPLKLELIKKHNSLINLALSYTRTKQPSLIIMHGFSGTGKTTLSQKLLEKKSIIRIRSDVERKRLFGLGALFNSHVSVDDNLYSSIATDKTYQHIFKLTKILLQNNYTALIDASFLSNKYRQQALQLAEQNNAQFIIIDCHANKDELQKRITKRLILNTDASEANYSVLDNQIKYHDVLTKKELDYAFHVNTEHSFKSLYKIIL